MGKPYKIKRHKHIYRRSFGSIMMRICIIVAAIAVLFCLGWGLYGPVSDWLEQRKNGPVEETTIGSSQQTDEGEVTESEPEEEQTPVVEEPVQEATASMTAYLPTAAVLDNQLLTAAISDAKAAGYDSIMFDLKTDDGTVIYPIAYNESTDAAVTSTTTIDLAAVVTQIKDAGLTPVASIHTFRDHLYPSANKAAATLYMDSDFLWVDDDPNNGGKAWLNPFSAEAQSYIQKIVDDACNAGFEMIILQDVQFPEGYSLDMIDYGDHASDDKNLFLQQYAAQMADYAAAKGVELSCMLPASSMLGGNTAMYFGDTTAMAGESAAIDLRMSVFGSGLQTDQVSIPDPSANPYNTIKTASAAIKQKLPDCQLIAVLDGTGLSAEEVSNRVLGAQESGIERYIIVDPSLGQ